MIRLLCAGAVVLLRAQSRAYAPGERPTWVHEGLVLRQRPAHDPVPLDVAGEIRRGLQAGEREPAAPAPGLEFSVGAAVAADIAVAFFQAGIVRSRVSSRP
jgi:hypothetical protein